MTAVFKSRAETLRFYNKLKQLGVSAVTVPTPKGLSDVCGISVRFPFRDRGVADGILSSGRYTSFVRMLAGE